MNNLVFAASGFDIGDNESSDDDWSDMVVPKETLESDEELRMHLLGMNSYFTEQGAWLSYLAKKSSHSHCVLLLGLLPFKSLRQSEGYRNKLVLSYVFIAKSVPLSRKHPHAMAADGSF